MMKSVFVVGACLMLAAMTASAQSPRINVRIVDRHMSDTAYAYVVPGHVFARSHAMANCFGIANSVNCAGSTNTTGFATPPQEVSYSVLGATFTLQVPDGRLVVVNCESKYAPRGDYINRRSCRVPLVDEIRAEFNGDKAKLIWPVSLDGRKTESETYKILAILASP